MERRGMTFFFDLCFLCHKNLVERVPLIGIVGAAPDICEQCEKDMEREEMESDEHPHPEYR